MKKMHFPSKFTGQKIPEYEIKLKQINKLKQKILDAFNQDNRPRFEQRLGYLRENQKDNPALLAKSLSDLAEKISDPEIKLALLAEAVELNPYDTVALNSYGTALANHNQPAEAFKQFEKSLKIVPDDTTTLNSYGTALANHNQPAEAFKQFEKSLDIDPENTVALNSYGTALAKHNQPAEAFEQFEKSLEIDPNDEVTLLSYAIALELKGKYKIALTHLEKIALDKLPTNLAGFFCLHLGRLCYRTQQEAKGDEYFERAIKIKSDFSRLNAAKQLFYLKTQPAREASIEFLKAINQASASYPQASLMLALNLDIKGYFEELKGMKENEIYDLEMLNRAIYHKILNEISLLKMITLGIIHEVPITQDSLMPLVDNIEEIVTAIEVRRKEKEATVAQNSSDDYQKMIAIISDTAHDISDLVNNEMAVIEMEIRDLLRELPAEAALGEQLNELLEQVELTQNALNDIKAINQGIEINRTRFQIQELFDKFEKTRRLEIADTTIATIQLDIQNGEKMFYGDEEKIRSFLNELVANSLKHNAEMAEITIKITSQDVTTLPDYLIEPMQARTGKIVTEQQKFLAIIYRDNGKGIPKDKKTWILQPLTTTALAKKDEKVTGSGLGLFIIRKTLIKMDGYIVEIGVNGAQFEIYLPYQEEY